MTCPALFGRTVDIIVTLPQDYPGLESEVGLIYMKLACLPLYMLKFSVFSGILPQFKLIQGSIGANKTYLSQVLQVGF